MGWLDTLLRPPTPRLATAPAAAVFAAAAVVEPAPRPQPSDALAEAIARTRLATMGRDTALSIPAVRKAVHVIAGTVSTFALQLWAGSSQLGTVPPWLTQPERARPLVWTLKRTLDDLVWHDRAVWQVVDQYVDVARPRLSWFPARFRYVSADRVTPVHDPDDVDSPARFLIDGDPVPAHRPLVVFDGAGLGGLRMHGWAMLDLYSRLMEAAGRYADSPLPAMALKNTGADLEPSEIDQLLGAWENARARRSTAYLNSVLETETFGWSARELQLTEAREHAAQEVARLFGLPAYAVNAAEQTSMTYSNVTDRRRDLAEALRPWMAVVESTLSLDTVVPHGQTVRLNVDSYTRDDPEVRMRTWAAGIDAGVLSRTEARAAEPLATEAQLPELPTSGAGAAPGAGAAT